MHELRRSVESEWAHDFEQIFFEGIPFGNETIWLHKPSRTLIVTDLCQWWQGELPFATKIFAALTGVRSKLAVPRTIRLLVKDRQAARECAQRILALPFNRVGWPTMRLLKSMRMMQSSMHLLTFFAISVLSRIEASMNAGKCLGVLAHSPH